MNSEELAKRYATEIEPCWDSRLAPFVLDAIPELLEGRSSWLEMGGRTGHTTQLLLERLGPEARLLMVEPNPGLLAVARDRINASPRSRLQLHQDPLHAMSLLDESVDGIVAVGLEPTRPWRPVLEEATRLLKPGGELVLGMALRGSFSELIDIFREVLEKEDLIQAQNQLDALCELLPDPEELKHTLQDLGFEDIHLQERPDAISHPNAEQLLKNHLVRLHCLESCMALLSDRSWREGVQAGMARSLDTYFPEGVDLTLRIGRIHAHKPLTPRPGLPHRGPRALGPKI